jgi:pyridoxal phosphate enzyme (YggS family)
MAVSIAPFVNDTATRLTQVQGQIARAAKAARRDPAEVRLVAVTKKREPGEIELLIAAGVADFGENRVPEALGKWPRLRAAHPALRLHMIGQLQSNKAEAAVEIFDVIHSLDRISLLKALVAAGERAGRFPEVYVQVNIGAEEQKGGVAIGELPAMLQSVRSSPLPLAGLMAMPPLGQQAGPYFALLAELARRHDVNGLSMGMSDDYATAVMLGATAVRVGSALFED